VVGCVGSRWLWYGGCWRTVARRPDVSHRLAVSDHPPNPRLPGASRRRRAGRRRQASRSDRSRAARLFPVGCGGRAGQRAACGSSSQDVRPRRPASGGRAQNVMHRIVPSARLRRRGARCGAGPAAMRLSSAVCGWTSRGNVGARSELTSRPVLTAAEWLRRSSENKQRLRAGPTAAAGVALPRGGPIQLLTGRRSETATTSLDE